MQPSCACKSGSWGLCRGALAHSALFPLFHRFPPITSHRTTFLLRPAISFIPTPNQSLAYREFVFPSKPSLNLSQELFLCYRSPSNPSGIADSSRPPSFPHGVPRASQIGPESGDRPPSTKQHPARFLLAVCQYTIGLTFHSEPSEPASVCR